MLDMGEEGDERKLWCPLTYEFLLNFCYTYGLIGHTGRSCEIQLKKGKAQQFSGSLCYFPERRRSGEQSRQQIWWAELSVAIKGE